MLPYNLQPWWSSLEGTKSRIRDVIFLFLDAMILLLDLSMNMEDYNMEDSTFMQDYKVNMEVAVDFLI
jgi:hypothetical protein